MTSSMHALRERAVVAVAQSVSGGLFMLGALGLLRTRFADFAASDGTPLLTMTTNPLTNVIHLVAGVVGIVMARTVRGADRYVAAVGVVALPFGLAELVLGDGSADIFGRDGRMAAIHVVLGLVGIGSAVWRRLVSASGGPVSE